MYNQLEANIGLDAANNLMKLLPYQPAHELITRTDMHAQTAALRGEMAELRAELQGEMVELRTDLRSDMAELRVELRTEMADLRGELRTEMAELKGMTQRLFGASIVVNAVAVTVAGIL